MSMSKLVPGINEIEKQYGKHYVQGMTVPRAIPENKVLVHNHVKHSTRTRSGTNGFRGWFQEGTEGLETCDCGWAGLPHYRVAGIPE